MSKLTMNYAVPYPSIYEQVKQQGFDIQNVRKRRFLEEARDAIIKLHLHDVITEGQRDKLFERLNRKVVLAVMESK